MKLPTCWSCDYKFKWKELIFFIEGRKKCPKCEEKQYTTTHSKWKMGMVFLPAWLCTFINLYLTISLFLICYYFMLYQVEFTDKQQPLY
ncbi:TIGR04104 family putative zinc finger protein [Aquisalibacillus elongatus]|uniref:CXXC-20-CXXC protein n=1 Tax=Aquisalibacillus elongatus TaxID=485577 RepID=A0A3N5C5K0_9BACI|nr:CXXC-20-CXXC protein [Aquisalibacillus elongatus]